MQSRAADSGEDEGVEGRVQTDLHAQAVQRQFEGMDKGGQLDQILFGGDERLGPASPGLGAQERQVGGPVGVVIVQGADPLERHLERGETLEKGLYAVPSKAHRR